MPGSFLRRHPVRSTLEFVLRMTLAPGALAVIGYGLGAIAYAVLAVQVGVRRRRAGRAGVMLFAAVSSFLWQLSGVLVAVQPSDATSVLYLLLDALRVGAWCAFALSLLPAIHLPGHSLQLSTRSRLLLSVGLTASLWIAITLRPVFAASSAATALAFSGLLT